MDRALLRQCIGEDAVVRTAVWAEVAGNQPSAHATFGMSSGASRADFPISPAGALLASGGGEGSGFRRNSAQVSLASWAPCASPTSRKSCRASLAALSPASCGVRRIAVRIE